jgi:hypothetical protein
LEKVKGSQLAKEREDLLEEVAKKGQFTQLALTKPEILREMQVCDSDVISCTTRESVMRIEHFTHNLMRPVGMGVNETLVKLAVATRLIIIEELFPDLCGKINQDLLNEVQGRHYVLVEGLQGKVISPEVARLFPRDRALAILTWYGKVNLCLEEMARVQGSQATVTWTLRELFTNYPGPMQAGNNWNQGRLREKSLVGEQEESIREVTGSNFRSTAMNAGRSYRMAEGSGRNRSQDEAMGPMHGTPTDLPSHLIRSKRETG